MAGYNEIRGLRVKYLSADPANAENGQVWYNSTKGTLRAQGIGTSAWSSASNLVTGLMGGITFGTQTAGNYVAGFSPSVPTSNANQEYNGTGWSTDTVFPSSQTGSGGGAGPQTAGLAAGGGGGSRTSNAFEYDGSSWTSTGSLPSAADNIGSCGTETQSNVIMAMGRIPSTGNAGNNTTATYNGSVFSSGPNVGTGRMFGPGGGAGTGTAGLVFGGFIDPSPNAMTNTEEYDGSSWTAGGSLSNPSGLNCGWGTQTNAIAQCNPSTYKTFEGYDGTSWSSKPSTATNGNGYANAAGATGSAGWITSLGPTYKTTEEFNFSSNTITAAAWASGGNLNTARSGHAMATDSPADTGLCFGGNYPSGTDNCETYNGTSWSEGNNLPQAISFLGGAGTSTAGLSFTGRLNPGSRIDDTYEYDGSSWTAGGNYGTDQAYTGGAGSQTAALGVAGETPPGTDLTTSYEYNGSAWTAGNACNVPGYDPLVFGTSAGAHMACLTGPPSSLETEAYDGTNWTASATAIVAQNQGGASGTYPIGLIFGGASTVPSTSTQGWDGTSWSTRPTLATGRRAKGSGVTAQGLAAGGETPGSPTSNATEEFTPETTTVTAKTLTTS